jgi:hypothetical protein
MNPSAKVFTSAIASLFGQDRLRAFAATIAFNMKVYLRHVKHGMYYCGRNTWTSDTTLAVKFETPAEAMWAARGEKMTQMEIVVREGNPPGEKVLAIIQ